MVEDAEMDFRLPIVNPMTGECIESHNLMGIIDLIKRGSNGGSVIVDHKTVNQLYTGDKVRHDIQMSELCLPAS